VQTVTVTNKRDQQPRIKPHPSELDQYQTAKPEAMPGQNRAAITRPDKDKATT